jgi:adenine deaminase
MMMEKATAFSAVGVLVVAFALPGCSRDRHCSELEVQVVGDHAHSVKVSSEKVKRAAGGAYRVHGADHQHALLLREEDMQKLALGASVTVRTSSTNAHMHEATVRCED